MEPKQRIALRKTSGATLSIIDDIAKELQEREELMREDYLRRQREAKYNECDICYSPLNSLGECSSCY